MLLFFYFIRLHDSHLHRCCTSHLIISHHITDHLHLILSYSARSPLIVFYSSIITIFYSLNVLGKLAGTDTRWDVISQSVDDRTDSERGAVSAATASASSDPELVAGGTKRLFKSRYSSVSRFIGKTESEEEQKSLDALNDIDANMDEEAFSMLLEGGLDPSLAAHIAHLFVRDPLVIFDDAIVLDDKTAMVREHFTLHCTAQHTAH